MLGKFENQDKKFLAKKTFCCKMKIKTKCKDVCFC